LLDSIAIIITIPCSLIRFGNLLNSELYGKPTNVPWAFIFERIDNVPRHPVVLYESIAYIILFFVTWRIYKHFGRIWQGFYVAFFFTTVFSIRFIIEFWKEPEGAQILPFISRTQSLSLPFILVGIAAFTYFFFSKDKNLTAENAK
jgi:prolipoprotein diacylglyceryltransferase